MCPNQGSKQPKSNWYHFKNHSKYLSSYLVFSGVLQAINKNEGEFFTKEDEGLMQIMAQLATAVLRNSLYHDEREIFHNSMKLLLESGKALSQE